MQKVRVMDGFHEGAIIEVPEPVPEVINLAVHHQETLYTKGPEISKQTFRTYNYRVDFFSTDPKAFTGEWRAFLES